MRKVLLVDDDEDIRKLYEFAFTKEGYEVASASDGISALEKMKNGEWEIILLDVQMPGMSGIEVLEKLKEENSEILKKSHIFLLTNLGKDEVVQQAHELGVSRVIVKSLYRPKDIPGEVSKYLSPESASMKSSVSFQL